MNSIECDTTHEIHTGIVLCDKHDVILKKIDDTIYTINFYSKNPTINFRNIINFDLYKILTAVNVQYIESCTLIRKISDSVHTFLFLFKDFGFKNAIPKKYMYVETTEYRISDTTTEYRSVNLDEDEYIRDKVGTYEQITCHESILSLNILHDNIIDIKYHFNIDIHEDLPIFIENIMGIMMKKIMLNLKVFIDNV